MKTILPNAIFVFGLCLQTLAAAPDETSLLKLEESKVRYDAAKVVYDQVARLILKNGKYCADNHSGDNTLKNIKAKGVPADFAAQMLPADDAPFELRRQYVMVMAELESPSRHLALIDKLVGERPDDHDLSALQLVAAPSARRGALIQTMARDPGNDLRALEERLPPLLDADHTLDPVAYRTMLENWRMVIDLFTAIPSQQPLEKHIHSYDPIHLLFGSSADQLGIPPLQSSLTSPAPTPELAALAVQRNETLHAVAMAMLANPITTRKAFAILHHGREVFHLNEATLRKLALNSCQLILRDEDQACRNESYRLGIFGNLCPRRFSETRLDLCRCSAGVTPYGYLLDLALKTQKFHDPSEFLQCFSKENRKTLKAGLDFFAKPTSRVARKILPEWVAKDEPIPAPHLALPAAIAGLCGIDTNKGFSTLLDATKPSELSDRHHQQIEILALWANVSLEHRNINMLASIIQDASQRFIGLPESTDTLSGPDAIGAILYRIHCPSGDCALIRVCLGARLPEPKYNFPTAPDIWLPESPSDSVQILLASHLFHPGPGMFAHKNDMISSSDDQGFLPFAVIGYKPKEEASEAKESSNRDLGREFLKIEGPERFWARITGAYLAKQDAAIAAAELERELTAIKTWPAAEQQSLAKFLLARWPALEKTEVLIDWFKQAALTPPKKGKDD